MVNVKRTPEIRIRGFANEWEQRKFGDVFDCTISNNTLSRAELNFDVGEVLNIHYGDVLIKYGSVIDVQRDNLPYVTGKTADDFKGAFLQDGDIVIADTAEDETTGKACEIGNIQNLKVVSGLHTMVCRPKEDMALGYLGYYLNSDSYHHQLLPLMQGIKVLSLSRSNIQKTEVCYPHSKAEQQQISAFFTYVDNLITLHQRKYEKLLQTKKAMLEKMFPADGASVPEVRFIGFVQEWKPHKFSELYEKVTIKNDLFYGTDNIISVANMYFKPDAYVTDLEYLRTYNVFRLGNIAFEGNKSKNFAHGRFVENTIGDGIVSHVFDVFRPLTKYDLLYWKYAINNEQIMGKILVRCTKASTMMTNLVSKDFLEETILVPGVEEQKKIGAYFDQLDKLIELHKEGLEKLQSLKKALLEKMFV